MDICLKCRQKKELVDRSDYCQECYDVLKAIVHAAADQTREKEMPARGRPKIGITKTIKVTLPDDCWDWINEMIMYGHGKSQSEIIRGIIINQKKAMALN